MIILGLNYAFHDSSACIVRDNELIFAIEEERLTREKHTQKFPYEAATACLNWDEISADEIDRIAVSINPSKEISTKLAYAATLNGNYHKFIEYEFERVQKRHLAFWEWYHAIWGENGGTGPQVHFVDHHDAHVVGSHCVSPWKDSALLSIDGWGEWTTTWLGEASGTQITRISESFFPNSLGVFYSAVTEFCGFKPNYDEGKTMGLAPTGNADRFSKLVEAMVDIDEDGRVFIDQSWFNSEFQSRRLCNEKFHSHFGSPRRAREDLAPHHRDVAAAFQRVLEEKVLKIARVLEENTSAENLVFAGGVALNSVLNGRLLRETRFRDIYIMPGAGDNGTCIGAAAYVHSKTLGMTPRIRHDDPYLGTEFSNECVKQRLDEFKLTYKASNDICADTAKLLADGKIVGWFQGRMEFGPRALGNRSILADPSCPEMKDKVNAQVKHREAFRPFAPSVPVERAADYFDINVEAPFMLKVCQVKADKKSKIPAIVHVDGSARLHTVSSQVNPTYHRLLTEFERLSDHPVLLNTSFNTMGEPIVATPDQAVRCFFSTGLDALSIGDFLVTKQ